MATFATRDQENLVQGWEAAAAGAKTVGKGGRTLAPKTPGKNFVTPAGECDSVHCLSMGADTAQLHAIEPH